MARSGKQTSVLVEVELDGGAELGEVRIAMGIDMGINAQLALLQAVRGLRRVHGLLN